MASKAITKFTAETDEYNRKVKGAKSTLEQFGIKGKEAGSMIAQFDKICGTSIGTLGKLSVATAAVSGAMKVAKDAFFACESNVDAWGRTVEAAKGVYNGFLNAINNGDVGGFVSRIDEIVTAAKKAYDSLDELQTKATIIAPSQAKAQALITQQKEIIRKKGKDSEEGKAAQKRIQQLEPELKAGYTETAELNRQYFIDAVKAKAKEAGIILTNEMWRSFTDTKAFDAISARAKGSAAHDVWQSADGYGSYKEHFDDSRNAEKKFLDAFTDEFRKSVSPYLSAEWSARNSSYTVGISDARYTNTTTTTKTGGTKGKGNGPASTGSVVIEPILDESFIAKANGNFYKWGQEWGKKVSEGMTVALKTTKKPVETVEQTVNNALANSNKTFEDSLKSMKAGGEAVTTSWQDAASAISQVGGALQSIDDPGLKVAGIIAQAIANIALNFSKSLAGTVTPWDFIAGAAAGGATMIATIASIKSATAGSYAEGGIIPGASTGGKDSKWAYVAPGELILNRAQQGNLASQLSGTRGGGGNSVISGEQIVTVINAYGRRTGRGEILK